MCDKCPYMTNRSDLMKQHLLKHTPEDIGKCVSVLSTILYYTYSDTSEGHVNESYCHLIAVLFVNLTFIWLFVYVTII